MGVLQVAGWLVRAVRRAIKYFDFFNGTFVETFDALITSNGSTITMTLEKSGGGNLTMNFSSGTSTLDCTPAATIALTAGTDPVPQDNYIYVLQSTRALTKSTSDWPTTEHIKVSYLFVPSAALVNTGSSGNNFAYINQNWNDHASNTNSQGHMSEMAERERRTRAKWFSGCEGVTTQDGNDLWVSIAAGVVYQMHRQVFSALDSDTAGAGDTICIINDPDTAFTVINSLNEITKDSTGSALGNNKYLPLVLWASSNKTGTPVPMFINLPTGTYNTQSEAELDVEGYADHSIPREFGLDSSTGFLVSRFIVKHTATAMEIQSTTDLRGQDPINVAGGGTGGGDVTAAAALTDNRLVRGDGGAKGVQTSGVIISDADAMSGVFSLTLTNPLPATSGGTGQASFADGDVLYGRSSGGGNWDKLALGTEGKVLTAGVLAPEWADPAIRWPQGTSFPGSPVADQKFVRTDLEDTEFTWDSVRSHWFGPMEFIDFGTNSTVSDGEIFRSSFGSVQPSTGQRGWIPAYNTTAVALVCRNGTFFTGSYEIVYNTAGTGITVVFSGVEKAHDLDIDYDIAVGDSVGVRINITSGACNNPTARLYIRRRG